MRRAAGVSYTLCWIAPLVVACHDPADTPVSPDSGIDGGVVLPAPVWTPCSLLTDGTGSDAECSTSMVPLDWSHPEGRQISYFVKRYHPSVTTHGDLFMLAGGPGNAGDGFEAAAQAIAEAGHVDVYMPDHRGTGRSSRLGCIAAEQKGTPLDYNISPDELAQCLASADTSVLSGFTVSNAARDVGWMISQTKTAGRDVDVYGVSYGTYLTLRVVQLFPDDVSAVVLDSLCPPGACFLSRITTWTNNAGKAFFATCGADAFCGGKLTADPWTRVGAAFDRLDAGTCPEATAAGFNRTSLRTTLNLLVDIGGFSLRPLAPALVYRIARCSTADRHALARAGAILFPPAPDSLTLRQRLTSQILPIHLSISELYESPPPSLATQQVAVDAAYVASNTSVNFAQAYDTWPRYDPDPLAQTWPTTTVPLLVMHASDDYIPASDAAAAQAHFTGAHQQYVVLPRAQHHVINNSPVTTSAPPCGQTLLTEFVANPTGVLDVSCLGQIQGYGFTVDPAVATSVFGTTDAFEGDPGP